MEGITSYWHCIGCKSNVEFGAQWHCRLCHATYPKGTQHTCKVIDEVVATADEPEPSTIPDRFKNAHVMFFDARPVLGARNWSEVTMPEGISGE